MKNWLLVIGVVALAGCGAEDAIIGKIQDYVDIKYCPSSPIVKELAHQKVNKNTDGTPRYNQIHISCGVNAEPNEA